MYGTVFRMCARPKPFMTMSFSFWAYMTRLRLATMIEGPVSSQHNESSGMVRRQIRPERWLIGDNIDTVVPSRKDGVMHHIIADHARNASYILCGKIQERTFFFFSSSAERSSRAFSCDLRFFRSVSGTRICSWVGVERLSEGIVAVVEVELWW